MANKEISALNTLSVIDDTSFIHVKHGGVDYKIVPQTLFNLYNAQTAGNEQNLTLNSSDVGLGNVTNALQLTAANNLSDVASASAARTNLAVDSATEVTAKVNTHATLTTNPHSVTKSQVGLGNVPNYAISSTITDTSNTKFATIGAVTAVNTRVTNIEPNVIPAGAIMMWGGLTQDVPLGWKVMDGTNGTVNMIGFVPRGSDNSTHGQTGGADSVKHTHGLTIGNVNLKINQVPNHSHDSSTGTQLTPKYGKLSPSEDYSENWGGGTKVITRNLTGPVIGNTNTANADGDSHTHTPNLIESTAGFENNVPAYRRLVFIIKT